MAISWVKFTFNAILSEISPWSGDFEKLIVV